MTNVKDLYVGKDALEFIKNNLVELRKNIDKWEVIYLDPKTNESWILDYPNAAMQGGGSPRLRKIESNK